jgi:hypothetical protein
LPRLKTTLFANDDFTADKKEPLFIWELNAVRLDMCKYSAMFFYLTSGQTNKGFQSWFDYKAKRKINNLGKRLEKIEKP